MKKELVVIGWREWVHMPDLGIQWLKAKIDTGARTSALHAGDIEYFEQHDETWVRFTVHPLQRSKERATRVFAKVIEMRKIRSSNGKQELRPVIETTLDIGGSEWPIELTLTRRDEMGFRMLLGRQGMRGHCLVHPGRSYLTRRKQPKPKRKKTSTQPKPL